MDSKTFLEPSLEKQLKGHRNGITALHFSPNNNQIATSSLDNSVLLWDLRGTMRSYRFQGHDEAVMDVAFSPTGKYMASASRDKTVRLWVPTVTGSTGVFKAHSQTVRSVQFSPDATKILTASDDKIVKLWLSEKHKFLSSFVGHTNWVRCARMSNDGSVIASCSDDKTARLWNPESSECVHTYKDQKGHGLCLAWHPSGCYIAIGTSQGSVKLYDTRTHNLVQYYSIHNDAVTKIAFHPSGSYILTASKDGKMKILDLLEGHPIFTLSGHSGGVNAVGFSINGDSFSSAGDDKLVFIWKTNFTELQNDENENIPPNPQSTRSAQTSRDPKGASVWSQCYHSTNYPKRTFIHLDTVPEPSLNTPSRQGPMANSTFIHSSFNGLSQTDSRMGFTSNNDSLPRTPLDAGNPSPEFSSFSVGHISHIPRIPPKPTSVHIPNLNEKSVGTDKNEDFFGMIALKENDVCYTSGTIEWVGKKRNFPINSGFKIMHDCQRNCNEPSVKKMKKLDKTFTYDDNGKDCECADVLPTVNAIVNHLNALHEAVDIVDLRLNTLEDTFGGHNRTENR